MPCLARIYKKWPENQIWPDFVQNTWLKETHNEKCSQSGLLGTFWECESTAGLWSKSLVPQLIVCFLWAPFPGASENQQREEGVQTLKEMPGAWTLQGVCTLISVCSEVTCLETVCSNYVHIRCFSSQLYHMRNCPLSLGLIDPFYTESVWNNTNENA